MVCVACVRCIHGQCLRRVWRVYVVPEQSRVTGKVTGALGSNQRRHRSTVGLRAGTGSRTWNPQLPAWAPGSGSRLCLDRPPGPACSMGWAPGKALCHAPVTLPSACAHQGLWLPAQLWKHGHPLPSGGQVLGQEGCRRFQGSGHGCPQEPFIILPSADPMAICYVAQQGHNSCILLPGKK